MKKARKQPDNRAKRQKRAEELRDRINLYKQGKRPAGEDPSPRELTDLAAEEERKREKKKTRRKGGD